MYRTASAEPSTNAAAAALNAENDAASNAPKNRSLTARISALTRATASRPAGATLSIEQHAFITLVGPAGGGKSTLLKLIGALIRPSRGKLLFDGAPLGHPTRDVGIVFQEAVLLEWRTVLDNVLLPAEILGLDRARSRARSMDLIALVGLGGFERRYPRELSGGMQQRVSLCRALIHNPSVLLMEEPFAALAFKIMTDPFVGQLIFFRVYSGVVNSGDTVYNPIKGKKLTNIRTHAKDEAVRLIPPMQMTLEKALAYIGEDELVEVTPKAIRLRKKLLDPNERRKDERRKEAEGRGKLLGLGLAHYVESAIGAPHEKTDIRVTPEGRVRVVIGTGPSGQGHETSFAQVVSSVLAVPQGAIAIVMGDTDVVSAGGGSHSGRSMRHAATLFWKAAPDLIEIARGDACLIADEEMPSREVDHRNRRDPFGDDEGQLADRREQHGTRELDRASR